jgi:hypothetical protein
LIFVRIPLTIVLNKDKIDRELDMEMVKQKHTLDQTGKDALMDLIASCLDRDRREVDTAYIHGSFINGKSFSDEESSQKISGKETPAY